MVLNMAIRIPILGLTLRDALIIGLGAYGYFLYQKPEFREKQLAMWGKLLDGVWDLVQRLFHMGPHRKKEDPLEDLDELKEGL